MPQGYPVTRNMPPINLGNGRLILVCGGYAGCIRCGSAVGYQSDNLLAGDCRTYCPSGSRGPITRLAKGLLPRPLPNGKGQEWPSGELSPSVFVLQPAVDRPEADPGLPPIFN